MDDMYPLDEVIMINEHVPNNEVPAEEMDDMYPLDEVIMINEHVQNNEVPAEKMEDMNPLDEVIRINEHILINEVPAEDMEDMNPLEEVIMISEQTQDNEVPVENMNHFEEDKINGNDEHEVPHFVTSGLSDDYLLKLVKDALEIEQRSPFTDVKKYGSVVLNMLRSISNKNVDLNSVEFKITSSFFGANSFKVMK